MLVGGLGALSLIIITTIITTIITIIITIITTIIISTIIISTIITTIITYYYYYYYYNMLVVRREIGRAAPLSEGPADEALTARGKHILDNQYLFTK